MNEGEFLMGTLKMLHNGKLIEGHPIGVSKIIKGDLRKREWTSDDEIHKVEYSDGEVLYDRTDTPIRPWFILVYESGRRVTE